MKEPIQPEEGLAGIVRHKQYGFRFNKGSLEEQCADVCKHLDALIGSTLVPRRLKKFCLNEGRTEEIPKPVERRLEQAIWCSANKGYKIVKLGDLSLNVHTYQLPLWRHKGDLTTIDVEERNKGWKRSYVDLLGTDTSGYPVVFELKKTGKGSSNPLHMVVEAALYGVAIKQMWPDIIPEWEKAFGVRAPKPPLKVCRLVGIAPEEYWNYWFGDKTQRGLWQSLNRLCLLLGDKGLPVSFASFRHGPLDGSMTEISDLRAITLPG